MAVARLIRSQTRRFGKTTRAGARTVSSPAARPRRWMSSVASSRMTSMMSSTVITPGRRWSRSTTGMATRLYFATSPATSSWSVSGVTLTGSSWRRSLTGAVGSAVISRRQGRLPTRWSWSSTT